MNDNNPFISQTDIMMLANIIKYPKILYNKINILCNLF